ncbi:MAG: hypothetical protein HKN45_05535 [Flavobacteriales bacterium]|nr:hypothetical protein [Flavobacteriales bacterium]
MSNLLQNILPEKTKASIGRQLRNLRLHSLEAKAYRAYSDLPENENINLMIFAQGRTGSTLLESLISSNHEFHPLHEVISKANTAWKRRLKDPNKYIEGLSKINADKNIVCHVKINHLIGHQKVDPSKFIKRTPEHWKLIYLYRENIVLHALSTFIADARKTYHTTDENLAINKIDIDIRYFEKLAKGRLNDRQKELDALGDRERLTIEYEKGLIDNEAQQRTLDQVADFLGLEAWKAETSLKKVNKSELRDLISNYDEFIASIQRNAWQAYIESQ